LGKGLIEPLAATRDDALYQAISEGRRFAGMEHWLPLFYEKLDTLFDYTEGYQFTYSHDVIEAVKSREEQIKDHYDSRQQAIETKIDGGTPYKPVDPENIYLTALEIEQRLTVLSAVALSPYDQPPTSTMQVLDAKGKSGRSFAVERTAGQNVFDAVAQHVKDVTKLSMLPKVNCLILQFCLWKKALKRQSLPSLQNKMFLAIDWFDALPSANAIKTL